MISEPISCSQNLPFRLITMSTTVITPQLMTILQDVIDATSWDSDLHRCASQTLQHCQDCSRHYLFNASRQLGINTETLLLAQNLYGILDSSILAASIEDKISLYQTVYLTALKQAENDLPYNISLQACSFYRQFVIAKISQKLSMSIPKSLRPGLIYSLPMNMMISQVSQILTLLQNLWFLWRC